MNAKTAHARRQVSYILDALLSYHSGNVGHSSNILELSNVSGFNPTVLQSWFNGTRIPSLTDLLWLVYSLNAEILLTDFDRKSQYPCFNSTDFKNFFNHVSK